MSTQIDTAVATQVFRIYIKASPQAIWDAITKPEWTQQYGYRGRAESRPAARRRYSVPATAGDEAMGMPSGAILEGEVWRPIRRAGSSRRGTRSGARTSRPSSRRASPTTSRRTTTASRGSRSPTRPKARRSTPRTIGFGEARVWQGGGGWPMILSDLKTLLETGESFMR